MGGFFIAVLEDISMMFLCPICHKPIANEPGQIVFKCCGGEWLITEIYKAEREREGKKRK